MSQGLDSSRRRFVVTSFIVTEFYVKYFFTKIYITRPMIIHFSIRTKESSALGSRVWHQFRKFSHSIVSIISLVSLYYFWHCYSWCHKGRAEGNVCQNTLNHSQLFTSILRNVNISKAHASYWTYKITARRMHMRCFKLWHNTVPRKVIPTRACW